MRRYWLRSLVVCVILVLGAPRTTRADPEWIVGQPSDEIRMTELSMGALLDGGFGFGFSPGLLMSVTVLDSGFVPSLNDSFAVEFGAFMSARIGYRHDNLLWFVPEVGPRWNFHLTRRWDAFATLKAGWAVGKYGDFWFRGTLGNNVWLSDAWAVRLELSPGTIAKFSGFVGLTYKFL